MSLLLPIIYLAFISLGLPSSALGSAWPVMQQEMSMPISGMGVVSFIISCGTIIASLICDALIKKYGTGKMLTYSFVLSVIALFGFSASGSFLMLCIFALPYGIGSGSVDTTLNNYVAVHYPGRHINWLHSMWGVGASIGPIIMGGVLSSGRSWNRGYLVLGCLELVMIAILCFSLPMWKKDVPVQEQKGKALSIAQVLSIKGVKTEMASLFCYCALEQTAILWGCSCLIAAVGISKEKAASLASLVCVGIMVGRMVSGLISIKRKSTDIIRLGAGILTLGIAMMFLPSGGLKMAGLMLIGLGCAPVFPCTMQLTPMLFGKERSQAIIGVQMASAHTGTMLMPALFGLIAERMSATLMPLYMAFFLVIMLLCQKRLLSLIPS